MPARLIRYRLLRYQSFGVSPCGPAILARRGAVFYLVPPLMIGFRLRATLILPSHWAASKCVKQTSRLILVADRPQCLQKCSRTIGGASGTIMLRPPIPL